MYNLCKQPPPPPRPGAVNNIEEDKVLQTGSLLLDEGMRPNLSLYPPGWFPYLPVKAC